MFRPVLTKEAPPPKRPKPIVFENLLGVDFNSTPTQIDKKRSPEMLNMITDNDGALDKRTGFSKVFSTSLGAGQINGIFNYRKLDGTIVRILAHGTKLYTWDDSGDPPTEIYSGVANSKVASFEFGGNIYFLDGTNYLVYNGTTVSDVTSSPYIPTLLLGRSPTGGGNAFEDFNLIGAGFKNSFNGDNSSVNYTLSLADLDATAVTATVDGVAKVETTDFTVNRTTGVVTFNVAPPTGTDNVVITAYKTVSGFADRIKNCRFGFLFGGANDTRVFVSGNDNYWNTDWRSGLDDPSYFPENGFVRVGRDNEKITGYTLQYDTLIIHKENSMWQRQYILQEDGTPTFPIKPVNDTIGSIAKDSIQLIDNKPVGLHETGVYVLTASSVRDERNMVRISENIEPNILEEVSKEDAISVDFENRYYLVLNGKAYVYDYRIKEWFYWENINASCFLIYDEYLYFGSNSEGLVYKFKKADDLKAYSDDGTAIEAYWKSKIIYMDTHAYKKMVDKVFVTIKPNSLTSAEILYVSDKKVSGVVRTVEQYLFDYINFNYVNWSYQTSRFPTTVRCKVKAKKIVYFQLIVRNDVDEESLGLLSGEIHYQFLSEVK